MGDDRSDKLEEHHNDGHSDGASGEYHPPHSITPLDEGLAVRGVATRPDLTSEALGVSEMQAGKLPIPKGWQQVKDQAVPKTSPDEDLSSGTSGQVRQTGRASLRRVFGRLAPRALFLNTATVMVVNDVR